MLGIYIFHYNDDSSHKYRHYNDDYINEVRFEALNIGMLNKKEDFLFCPPIHLKYIFSVRNLLKSPPNTYVKIKLRKAKLMKPQLRSFQLKYIFKLTG